MLSRQSYATEDSSGHQGQVRAVKKYPGGGYEIIVKDYIARCYAPFDHMVEIIWSNPGQEDSAHSVAIKNSSKLPEQATKESYNLYWAACHGQFQKFKNKERG
jgi:hypothetical protein